MKNCISADKLTLYVDGLLEPQERNEVMQHLRDCQECRMLLAMFEEENKVLKETLSSPKLPDSFTDNVLHQLEPIKSKRKAYWIRGFEVAAAAVLCISLATAVSPDLRGFVSGLFLKEDVEAIEKSESEAEKWIESNYGNLDYSDIEENLKQGIVYPIESYVEGDSRKLFIDTVVVDVNRIGVALKVMDKKGEVLVPDISIKALYFKRQDGSLLPIDVYGTSMHKDGYAFVRIHLGKIVPDEKLTLVGEVERLAEANEFVTMEVPIDFKEAKQQAKVLTIENGERMIEEHEVHFEQLVQTPFQTTFTYRIKKMPQYEIAQEKAYQELIEKYGSIHVGDQAGISFAVMNQEGQQIAKWAPYTGDSDKFLDVSTIYDGGESFVEYDVTFEPLTEEPAFIQIDDILYSNIEAGSVTFESERLTISKPEITLEATTLSISNMNLQGEELLVSMDIKAHEETFYIDQWILIDGKGGRYSSNSVSSSIKEDGTGHYNIKFNKPSVKGPYTLIAVSSTKHVLLEEPVKIQIK